MEIVREATGWLSGILSVVGFVVCAAHFGRTRWARVLTAGFALETLVLMFYRLTMFFVSREGFMASGVQGALAFASLIEVAARIAIVAGVAGVLGEIRALSERTPHAAP